MPNVGHASPAREMNHADKDRCPEEFHYWANVDKPWVRALRTLGRTVLGFDPAPADEVVRTFASTYYDADPLAEAFVDDVYFRRGSAAGRAMLDQALAHGASSVEDAPASLLELFEDVERDPDWLDRNLVERGARVFRRYGTSIFRFAGAVTLAAYSESSVAKPLVLTGGYAGDKARHRFLETIAFWISVSEPGALEPFGAGRASALRVRIMHVFVRRRLLAHPEWKLEKWGVPISQGDALLTLMGGSFVPGVVMQAMGYRPSVQDIEAMMHFWRYIGHLMGVRPRVYPASWKEATQLFFVTLVKGAHTAGDDGRYLCQSFLQAFAPDPRAPFAERMRQTWEHRVHVGTTRFFLPRSTYRTNGLPPAGVFALYPLVQFPFIFTAETLRRRFPPLDDVADRVARRSRDRWFSRHMGARHAEYRPVEAFTR